MDNSTICMEMKHSGLKVWQSCDGKWTRGKHTLSDSKNTLEAVSALLQRGAMKEIYDFDNFLDTAGENLIWNTHLNLDLKKILSMH